MRWCLTHHRSLVILTQPFMVLSMVERHGGASALWRNRRKTRKWVGRSSHNSDFFFFFLLFFVVFSGFQMFQKKLKKMDRGMGWWGLTNPSFSQIFEFF